MDEEKSASNTAARSTWERKAVGSDRANGAPKGSREYFDRIRAYRYGYETPFIPKTFQFSTLEGKRVLEIGVGNGIDAVEMMRHGAIYTGLDITRNHLDLTRTYIETDQKIPQLEALIEGDLLNTNLSGNYDVVYSFGVLHHILHEADYLRKIKSLLHPNGKFYIAVYSKWSFFNLYLFLTWILNSRPKSHFDDWRSHIAEHSHLGSPVTIRIRSRSEFQRAVEAAGFRVDRYEKRGFVQNYIPIIGKYLVPDGVVLRALGSILGWYHCLTLSVFSKDEK